MDFGLWSILETKACRTSHPNLDSLKRKLTLAWDENPEHDFQCSVSKMSPRFAKLVEEKQAQPSH